MHIISHPQNVKDIQYISSNFLEAPIRYSKSYKFSIILQKYHFQNLILMSSRAQSELFQRLFGSADILPGLYFQIGIVDRFKP